MSDETIRVVIKNTRIGKLATYKDADAVGGLRGMTDAETKAHDFMRDFIDSVDAAAYESGDLVAEITVPESGEPYVSQRNQPDHRSEKPTCENK